MLFSAAIVALCVVGQVDEPVVSKQEIDELVEEDRRASKWLMIGTGCAVIAGGAALCTTVVSGFSAFFAVYGTWQAWQGQGPQWQVLSLLGAAVFASLGFVSLVLWFMSFVTLLMGIRYSLDGPPGDL